MGIELSLSHVAPVLLHQLLDPVFPPHMWWLVRVSLQPFPPVKNIWGSLLGPICLDITYMIRTPYLHILRAVWRTRGPSALLLTTMPSTSGVAKFILPTCPASLTLTSPLARGWRKITRQTVLMPGTRDAKGIRSASSRLSTQMRTTRCSWPPPEGPPRPGFLDLLSSPTWIKFVGKLNISNNK